MSKKLSGSIGPHDIRSLARELYVDAVGNGLFGTKQPEWIANECYRYATGFFEFDPDEYARRLEAETANQEAENKAKLESK